VSKVNIICAMQFRGGVGTFVKHLTKILGPENVNLLRLGKVRRKYDYGGLEFLGVTPEDVPDLPTLLVSNATKSNYDLYARLMDRIPCMMTFHGRGSIEGKDMRDISARARVRIAIRKVLTTLVPDTIYLRHPYVASGTPREKTRHAISHSQVVPGKGQDIILEVNRFLPEDRKIEIWGTGMSFSRMWIFHSLSKHPEWRGPKPFTDGLKLCEEARYDVDLSRYLGDGGGTQYTFLEACDGRAVPVVRRDWLDVDGDIHEGEHCLAIEGIPELVQLMKSDEPPPQSIIENNLELLKKHRGDEWRSLFYEYRA
jgi:hypothetical protein